MIHNVVTIRLKKLARYLLAMEIELKKKSYLEKMLFFFLRSK